MPAEEAVRPDQTTGVIERELRIQASPPTIFRHLVDPERMRLWLGDDAELVPEPGGLFRVTVAAGVVARGEFVAVEPDRRVVFTWGWEDHWNPLGPGTTTVEIELEADGETTVLRLRHSGLPDEQVAFHAWGWRIFLPRLVTISAGGSPSPNPLADVFDSRSDE